jgi:tetratricopeptide (TPR) repeat protein
MSQELERIAASRAREAVNYDKMGQRLKAVKCYREAIDILWKLYKLAPENTIKRIYADKIKEYQSRIEELSSDAPTKKAIKESIVGAKTRPWSRPP